MPGIHAKKSPSKAKLLHSCAGALPLIETIPPEQRAGAGDAARMGTAAHYLLEQCLSSQKHPERFAGRFIVLLGDEPGDEGCSMLKPNAKQPDRGVFYEVDERMVEGVAVAYDYVMRRCEELRFNPKDLILEAKTNPVPDREDTKGTADVTIDAWPVLEVVDYKNGYVTVEHTDNEQLLSYLAGRAQDTGWEHEEYMITVAQPNAYHEEGDVRTFPISKEDLLAFVDKHRAAAEAADAAADAYDGDPKKQLGADTWSDRYLTPGDHCDDCMCEARLICPAVKRWKEQMASVDFDDDPLAEPPSVDGLEEAVKVLKWAPYLQAQIAAAHQVARNVMIKGGKHPDLKVVRGRSKREWDMRGRTPYQIAAQMVKDGIISDNERALLFTEPSLITGPQAEALIKGKGSGKRKETFNQKYLTIAPGALKVVLASEPGEAVSIHPGDDFEDDNPLED